MKINYTYRMYGRSKGRGKKNEITDDAISIKVKKIDKLKINNYKSYFSTHKIFTFYLFSIFIFLIIYSKRKEI